MYPSNCYLNFSFHPFNDFIPNSQTQNISTSSSSCLFHFPSPLNQYKDQTMYLQYLNAINSQNNVDNIGATNEITVPETTPFSNQNHVDMKKHTLAGRSADHQPKAKKTVSKKDRHFKVQTALGLRDGRVRLSLDISKMFFELKDLLGSNNSKTIEWLLEQSKPAIEEQELAGQFPHMNKGPGISTNCASSSDREIVYGIDEHSVPETALTKADELPAAPIRSKIKRTKRVRGPSFDHFMTKESRTEARERARERSRAKLKHEQLDDQQSTKLMTWSPSGAGKELAGSSHNTISYNSSPPSLDVEQVLHNACEQQKTSQGIREERISISDPNKFVITESWSPSALFN